MSVIIGVISGILAGMGVGGGSLLIPALVAFLGVAQKVAQAANLLGFIPAAVASLWIHAKNRLLHFKMIAVVSFFGLAASLATAAVSVRMSDEGLKTAFAVFLIVMGIYEMCKKREHCQ